jgi:branched-chain amino acid transport system permease protein
LLRPVYGRPEHYQILLTYALLLVIEDGVKLLFGSAYKSLGPPAALAYPVWIAGAPFPAYYFVQIALALAVAGALWFFLQRTRSGALVRAATQDREMLEALGVNVPRLLTVVFAMGIALAALGGAATLPMQTVSPGIAVEAVISAFIVVVVGGLGSVWGALLGAFLIGEIQAFGVLVLPEFSIAFVYLLMVVVLLVRPWGLLGRPPAVRT